MTDRKQEGKHDYSGSYDPNALVKPPYSGSARTFSVGIFKWLPRANGKGLKKSAVVYRIRGLRSYPEEVYDAAERCCTYLDNGGKYPTKSISVGGL